LPLGTAPLHPANSAAPMAAAVHARQAWLAGRLVTGLGKAATEAERDMAR